MIVAERFLGLEHLGGHTEGYPDIYARKPMLEKFGRPEIDYDNLGYLLNELSYDEAEQLPNIALFHRFINADYGLRPSRVTEGISQHSFRLGNTLFINGDSRTDRSEPPSVDPERLMAEITLQAAAYSPGLIIHEKIRTTPRTVLVPVISGLAVAGAFNVLTEDLPASGMAGAMTSAGLGWKRFQDRKAQIRYDAEEVVAELLPNHRDDIVFPSRPS